MTANINVGGTWHSAVPWINVAGVWKPAQQLWQNVAGVWKLVFQLVTLTLASSSISASRATTGTVTATNTATGGPSGGSYSWTLVSGTAMTVSGGSTSSATFSGVVGPGTPSISAVYRCTYTLGAFSAFADTSVVLHYTGSGS